MADIRREHLVLGEQHIAVGEKRVVRVPVTVDLDGGEVAVWIHAIRGAKSGPTLGLLGLQHGNEWFVIDLFRQLVAELEPDKMQGTVLAVPVCSPPAFGAVQRVTDPASDAPDLNRVWPGDGDNWLPNQLARVIDREVLKQCDALLDFHMAPWGNSVCGIIYGSDYDDPEVSQRCRDLGIAFGLPGLERQHVLQVFPGPRSALGYASNRLGIPCLGVEIGGSGFSSEQEASWTAAGLRGIKNVMRHLGILEGAIEKPDRIFEHSPAILVKPNVGGLLIPERATESLMREVAKGEVLARVVSPYTFEELERLVAPCDGYLVHISRSQPVRPGGWAFAVIDAESGEWIVP